MQVCWHGHEWHSIADGKLCEHCTNGTGLRAEIVVYGESQTDGFHLSPRMYATERRVAAMAG